MDLQKLKEIRDELTKLIEEEEKKQKCQSVIRKTFRERLSEIELKDRIKRVDALKISDEL